MIGRNERESLPMNKIIIFVLLASSAAVVAGCAASSEVERHTPPSLAMTMRWVKSPDNDKKRSDPRAIFIDVGKADTVRTIIRTSGGEQVAREHIAFLSPGLYRLESAFTQLVEGTYFVEILNGKESMMRHITVQK